MNVTTAQRVKAIAANQLYRSAVEFAEALLGNKLRIVQGLGSGSKVWEAGRAPSGGGFKIVSL